MKKALPIIVYTLVLVLVTGMIASGATLLAIRIPSICRRRRWNP